MTSQNLLTALAFFLITAVLLAFAGYMVDVVSARPFENLPFTFTQDFAEILVVVVFLVSLIAACGALVVLFRAWR